MSAAMNLKPLATNPQPPVSATPPGNVPATARSVATPTSTSSVVPAVPESDPDIQTIDTPMPGKYRVKVIRSKCIAAASCVAIAPKVFELDAENIAKVISQDELDDIKLLAAQSCPTMAIIVEDIETGEQIWPQV